MEMRKRIIEPAVSAFPPPAEGWLDLERLARAEITSETAEHPIEAALAPSRNGGWLAARPGPQTIRLLFDQPQQVGRIHLVFEERAVPRTQEFVLRWSSSGGHTYREIARQQYNFSPPDTTREAEDYRTPLDNLTALEIEIVPDISGGAARASIAELRIS